MSLEEFLGLGSLPQVNDSAPLQETDSRGRCGSKSPVSVSCSLEESQKFDSFFSSLISEICQSCSRILKEGDDMKRVLQMEKSIVTELEGDGQDLDSDNTFKQAIEYSVCGTGHRLIETRSKAVLDVFRELALHYQISNRMGHRATTSPKHPLSQASTEYQSVSGHPKLKLSPTTQNIKSKDKMSIMIVNDGKPVMLNSMASGLEGGSLHEILTYLLEKKRGS
ncbi:TRANSPORTER putative (DUF179)-RELATED [Salix viminalis]|uniref:TRANSPORTER putative (DUF179)-RELATED n=1 Tax=Salix viminalis TaxID=40686 RepID=A0A9Q0NY81_SALVM|nr:TRANSPORTER putative (DUF179)-RELATED [Salix viminalis]